MRKRGRKSKIVTWNEGLLISVMFWCCSTIKKNILNSLCIISFQLQIDKPIKKTSKTATKLLCLIAVTPEIFHVERIFWLTWLQWADWHVSERFVWSIIWLYFLVKQFTVKIPCSVVVVVTSFLLDYCLQQIILSFPALKTMLTLNRLAVTRFG